MRVSESACKFGGNRNTSYFCIRDAFFPAMQNRVIQRMSLVSKSLVLNRLTSVNIYHSASTSDANALRSASSGSSVCCTTSQFLSDRHSSSRSTAREATCLSPCTFHPARISAAVRSDAVAAAHDSLPPSFPSACGSTASRPRRS